jgi:Fe-S cluster biosynthesis and repair protein YggX
MARNVNCKKLKVEAPGLAASPYPGELGQRIFEQISQQAWQLWLNQQTMLINEYRLSLIDPKAREFLTKEMEKFLFSHENCKPPGYVPPNANNNT